MSITAEQLREIVDYDGSLGVFFWRRSPSPQVKAGSRADVAGRAGYRVVKIGGKSYQAHRLAWLFCHGRHPAGVVDHWNGAPHDNRICNLRDATPLQNSWNSNHRVRSKFVRPGIWTAEFTKNGKKVNLGKFQSEEAAEDAKREAMAHHLGEFGRGHRRFAPNPINPLLLNPPAGSELFGSGI